jgi:hypothetical protein
MRKPPLSIVDADGSGAQPPRPLGQAGRLLWDRFSRSYNFSDDAGAEMLCTICEARDTAARLETEIERDGDVIRTRGGSVKAHPAQRDLLANRAFIMRSIDRLGLNSEAVRPGPGRPTGQRR